MVQQAQKKREKTTQQRGGLEIYDSLMCFAGKGGFETPRGDFFWGMGGWGEKKVNSGGWGFALWGRERGAEGGGGHGKEKKSEVPPIFLTKKKESFKEDICMRKKKGGAPWTRKPHPR